MWRIGIGAVAFKRRPLPRFSRVSSPNPASFRFVFAGYRGRYQLSINCIVTRPIVTWHSHHFAIVVL
jgi:hypothetical protein